MHALLYFRKQIWVQARKSLHDQADIHARLMSRYRQGLSFFWSHAQIVLNVSIQSPSGGILSSS
jgi:hypothetical protein